MTEGFFGRRSQGKGEMAFIDHLEELRWHIIRSLLAVMVFAVIIFIKIQWVFDNIIAGPINQNFVSYRFICNLSHKLNLGDKLCLLFSRINPIEGKVRVQHAKMRFCECIEQ